MRSKSILDIDALESVVESQFNVEEVRNWLKQHAFSQHLSPGVMDKRVTYYTEMGFPKAVYVTPFSIITDKEGFPTFKPRQKTTTKKYLYIIKNSDEDLQIPYFIKRAASEFFEIKFV
jgi:hypothetical protein